MVGDQFIMGQFGPVGLNLIAIGYALDNFYEEVTDKMYFTNRLKLLVSGYLEKQSEGIKNG